MKPRQWIPHLKNISHFIFSSLLFLVSQLTTVKYLGAQPPYGRRSVKKKYLLMRALVCLAQTKSANLAFCPDRKYLWVGRPCRAIFTPFLYIIPLSRAEKRSKATINHGPTPRKLFSLINYQLT